MTSEELRSDPVFVARMAELVSDPALQTALAVLKAEGEEQDAEPGADALASVRLLSRQKGRASIISELMMLAMPAPKEERQQIPTFGTGLTQEEAADALGLKA